MNSSLNIPQYDVTQFNKAIKDIVEEHFSYVSVKGEISELRIATKGQIYITLKDETSILSSVVWEQKKKLLQFEPEIGMEVTITGRVTTWSKFKTTYQIDVDKIEIAGEGALLKINKKKKKRLKEKGYFEASIKKKIPYLPSRIGVITSPTGSVIHDIINRVSNRFKTPIDLWPVAVQGKDSVKNIIDAIIGFNNILQDKPDVIIIARGGGSTEDLMGFNDERLAEAVYNSEIPIISAIGHETDTSIIDFVCDLRASTPTAAAELVIPAKSELINIIKGIDQRLNFGIQNIIKDNSNNLQRLFASIKTPEQIFNSFKERISYINSRFQRVIISKTEIASKDLSALSGYLKIPNDLIKLNKSIIINFSNNLNSLIKRNFINQTEKYKNYLRLIETNSVHSNLKKGYSILTKNKKIVNNSKLINKNDILHAKLIDRTIELKVSKIN